MKKVDLGTPGGPRTRLSTSLPLQAPFLVQIFPVYACNCKCQFCIYSLEKDQRGFISDVKLIKEKMFVKAIEEMKLFPKKIKMLRFAGIGEPLLHSNISKMIKIAKDANVADRVDIVTNGIMLNKSISNELIEAGLSTLRISVNGLNASDYKKNCGIDIDFDKYVEEIRYFYQNRGNTKVYIKIIDYMVGDESKKQEFYNLFDSISDTLAIEHLTPTVESVNIQGIVGSRELKQTQCGGEVLNANVCPQPFYMMQINPDGKVVPCCSMEYPCIVGDLNTEKLNEVWQKEQFNSFRREMLKDRKHASNVCEKCCLYKYGLYQEDILDSEAEELLKLY